MERVPDWFEALRAKRERFVAALIENGFERGLWNATVAKYADPTHFIFELLQNAEDEGATRATFRLEPGAIVFEHDGEAFVADDVDGITGLGNTTKLDEANKIGRFGIGFKSVFVVTEAPEIHATVDGTPLAFSIRDLVVPQAIAYAGAPDVTRVVLPLAPGEAVSTVEAVRNQLRATGPRAMLFLDSLAEISWTDGTTTEVYRAAPGQGDVRTLSREVALDRQEERYLVLSRRVDHSDAKRDLSVKLAFRMNAAGEVVREPEPTRLSVFFETEEITGLGFHLHGPFALTDNRANVKRGDPWNITLVEELARLLADSLPALRDRKLVTRSFLGVMPIPRDAVAAPWSALRDAAVEAFRTVALTPAQFGGHAPAPDVVRGPAELRDFLGDDGLSLLYNQGPRRWSISGSQRNDREDVFLTSLGIPEWTWADFTKALADGLVHARRKAVADWLDGLDDDTMRRLYGVLDTAVRVTRNHTQLMWLPIVRLEDGRMVRPAQALLPPADDRDPEGLAGSGLVLVKSAILAGRGRKETLEFLGKLGAHEVGEQDYVTALVDRHSSGASGNDRRDLREMQRFLDWWSDHKQIAPFKGKAFVRAEGVAGYVSAERIYLDAPYGQTGLARVYDGQTEGRDRLPLWSGYRHLNRETLVPFLRMCGAEDRLHVEKVPLPWAHSLRQQFPGRRVTESSRADEFTIRNLKALLARRDPQISKLIWRTMSTAGQETLHAVYTPNQQVSPQSASSHVVSLLANTAWIPAVDGTLKVPAEMNVADLAPGFTATGAEPWLRAIRFGEAQRRSVEASQSRRKAAESLGLSAEIADHLARMTPEDRKVVDAEFLRRLRAAEILPPVFPERSSQNPERRAERAAQRARDALTKTYEARTRSVRTTDGEVRAQAKTYLADLYTNEDGSMVCQCCHQRMPFNLPDGSPYFEAVACVSEEPRELSENHLAMCPTCAAKWHVANSHTPSAIHALLMEAEGLAIVVTLAGKTETLRFVEMHLLDLRAALAEAAAA